MVMSRFPLSGLKRVPRIAGALALGCALAFSNVAAFAQGETTSSSNTAPTGPASCYSTTTSGVVAPGLSRVLSGACSYTLTVNAAIEKDWKEYDVITAQIAKLEAYKADLPVDGSQKNDADTADGLIAFFKAIQAAHDLEYKYQSCASTYNVDTQSCGGPAPGYWEKMAKFQGTLTWGTCEVVRTGNVAVVDPKGEDCTLGRFPSKLENIKEVNFKGGKHISLTEDMFEPAPAKYNRIFRVFDRQADGQYKDRYVVASNDDPKYDGAVDPYLSVWSYLWGIDQNSWNPQEFPAGQVDVKNSKKLLGATWDHYGMTNIKQLDNFNNANASKTAPPHMNNLVNLEEIDASGMVFLPPTKNADGIIEKTHEGDVFSGMYSLKRANLSNMDLSGVGAIYQFLALDPNLKDYDVTGIKYQPIGNSWARYAYLKDLSIDRLDYGFIDTSLLKIGPNEEDHDSADIVAEKYGSPQSSAEFWTDRYTYPRYLEPKNFMWKGQILPSDPFLNVCDITFPDNYPLKDPDAEDYARYAYGAVHLSRIKEDDTLTGKWARLDGGKTIWEPQGPVLTREQLLDGHSHPGRWVCQRKLTTGTVPPPVEEKPAVMIPPAPVESKPSLEITTTPAPAPVASTTPAPAPSTPHVPSAPHTPAPAKVSPVKHVQARLPRTGATVVPLVVAAMLVIAAGVVLIRRPRARVRK